MSLHDSNNDSLRPALGPSPTSTAVQHPISSRRRLKPPCALEFRHPRQRGLHPTPRRPPISAIASRLKPPCVLGFRHPRQRGLHPTPRRPPISAIALHCCAQESYCLSLAAPSAATLHTVSTPRHTATYHFSSIAAHVRALIPSAHTSSPVLLPPVWP
jgi:hypothetical protein